MERNEQIRKELLFQLYALRLPRDAAQLERECRKQQLDFTRLEIEQELTFLSDEGLLIGTDAPGSTARRYRISSNGVRHYEQTYAA